MQAQGKVSFSGWALVGLPDRCSAEYIIQVRLPACMACGSDIEITWVPLVSFVDQEPYFVPGRWECVSGCRPGFRRYVVAANEMDHRSFCYERRWDSQRVIFVPDGSDGRHLRGCRIHGGMIHITEQADLDHRLLVQINTVIDRGTGGPTRLQIGRDLESYDDGRWKDAMTVCYPPS